MDESGAIVLSAQADIHLEAGSEILTNGPSGGEIRIESDFGTTWVEGTIQATGSEQTGGTVQVLGEQVGLIGQASVDVSGESGGGEVLGGGDYRGANPDVKNAEATFLGPQTFVNADALTSGDGGRIIIWAIEATRVYGELSGHRR